ncbi:MAG: cell envelope biosis protein OmpA [Chitinophagaceae bacterium]|nr:cell envelope biosis protein OmpA [Chitinophagaceae bacterium]
MIKKLLFVVVLATCGLTSCIVSKKKFDELSRRKSALEAEKADCEESLKAKQAELDRYTALSDSLIKDTTSLGAALRVAHANHASLNDSYQKLMNTHNKIVNNNQAELSKMSKNLSERELKINGLENELVERERRVKELERVIARKDSAVNAIKDKLTKSLLGFKDKEITVKVKDGKVYVSLSEQLLFKSGSTKVDEKGVEALKKLADAIKNDKDINITVEGHTDDVPVNKGANFEDNWELSVLRATSITKIMVNSGFPPVNIMPAGHGEFMPVAEGKSAEARRLNRRTEIIVSPKLEELFKLLNK